VEQQNGRCQTSDCRQQGSHPPTRPLVTAVILLLLLLLLHLPSFRPGPSAPSLSVIQLSGTDLPVDKPGVALARPGSPSILPKLPSSLTKTGNPGVTIIFHWKCRTYPGIQYPCYLKGLLPSCCCLDENYPDAVTVSSAHFSCIAKHTILSPRVVGFITNLWKEHIWAFLSLFLSCRFSLFLLPLSFPVHSPCLASNSFDLLSPTPLTRKNGNSRTAKPACFLKTSNRPLERDKLNQKWGPSIITFLGLLPSSRTRKRERKGWAPQWWQKFWVDGTNTHHTKPPRPPLREWLLFHCSRGCENGENVWEIRDAACKSLTLLGGK